MNQSEGYSENFIEATVRDTVRLQWATVNYLEGLMDVRGRAAVRVTVRATRGSTVVKNAVWFRVKAN